MKKKIMLLTVILTMMAISIACCVGCKNNGAHTHKYNDGEWTIIEQPTCMAEGKRKHICTICHEEQIEIMPKTPHAYATEWTFDVAPTDTTEGTESRHCATPGCHATTDARTAYFATAGLYFHLLADDTYEVTGFGAMKGDKLVIPMKYKGKLVTSIQSGAFYGCATLTSVTIPSSITAIGENAFNGCSGLTSITLPAGLTTMGFAAFRDCSGLTSVTIPSGITTISNGAFDGCGGLRDITIPTSVMTIGNGAFSGCSGVTIYFEATSLPTNLDTSWNLEKYPVVLDCRNNEVATDGYTYKYLDNIKYAFKGAEASVARQPKNIAIADIPASVTYKGVDYAVKAIYDYAFSGCSGLASVTLPTSVTAISTNTFSGCSGLTNITLSTKLATIGDNAFYGCSGLTNITLPASLTTIRSNAFSGCALTRVIMPKGVTDIEANAFYGAALTVYCEGTEAAKPINWNANWNGTSAVNWSSEGSAGFTFTPSTDSSSYTVSAFALGTDTEIIVPAIYQGKFVTAISNHVFANNNTLTKITIPNSVTTIGEWAFFACSELKSIELPNSVTSIGNAAFRNCFGLTSITIPSSVTNIGNEAFRDCNNLTSIAIPSSVTKIGTSAFECCRKLTSIIIPKSVTKIGANAFFGCMALTINCECTQADKPKDWDAWWNGDNNNVKWGYTGK